MLENRENLKDAIDTFVLALEEEQKNEKLIEEVEEENREEDKSKSGFDRVVAVLKRTIKLICLGEEIKIEANKDKAIISVYGQDLSIAIGKNGKNMEAIEYIINLIGKRKKLIDRRVIIDIKDYRKKNIEKIRKMAVEMANKAVREGRKITLKPMPSYERKIVHHLLSKMENVRTISRDEEPNRRIVIYPVGNNR